MILYIYFLRFLSFYFLMEQPYEISVHKKSEHNVASVLLDPQFLYFSQQSGITHKYVAYECLAPCF